MENENERNKFWKRRNPFFGMFEEFDKMDEMMDEMMKRAFTGMESMKGKPMSYGFSMNIGPDGKPKIREFGNIQPTAKEIKVTEHREPLVDVMDKGDEIDVLAELPGVEKQNIDVRAENSTLTINVPKKFFKEVQLPANVDKKSVKATYKNGVLTVTLKKMGEGKNKEKVKIE